MLKGVLIKIRSILDILQTFICDGDSIILGLAIKRPNSRVHIREFCKVFRRGSTMEHQLCSRKSNITNQVLILFFKSLNKHSIQYFLIKLSR